MLRAAARYVQGVWQYRFFWLSLVKGDLRRRYRRSVLGVGWSLLNPLLMAGVLCLVYRQVLDLPRFDALILVAAASAVVVIPRLLNPVVA